MVDCLKEKDTKGKYMPHLVLPALEEAVARVREYGVKKYGSEDGWRLNSIQEFADAAGRHYNKTRLDPLAIDEQSGLPHVAAIACNCMFILQLIKEDAKLHIKEKEAQSDTTSK